MLQKYKVTYRKVLKLHETIIEATSKYDAKKRFYRKYPRYEIIKVELAEVSSLGELSVVRGVANAQKQGAGQAESTEARNATMFQEGSGNET